MAAENATPWGAIIGAGTGLVQSIIGGIKASKAQKQLEKLQSPQYKQNQGVLDYYNQALARYNVSPTDSAMYKRQMRDVDRNVASGLNTLQDRRSTLAGTSSILRAANDAKLNANAVAEQERNQRFGVLGQATGMKAGEDRMAFEVNQQQPFERKYNLLAMKAGGANQTANAGLSNVFGGLQNLQNYNLYKQEYGAGRNSFGTGGDSGGGGISTDWLMSNRKMKLPK